MKRTIFRAIIAPLIFWLTSSVLLALFLPNELSSLTAGYALLIPTLLLAWWGIAYARSLRGKVRWESIPYFLANLILALMFVGLGVSAAMALADIGKPLAGLVFLFGCLGGVGWLLGSIGQRVREGKRKRYDTIFWRPLLSDSWIWRSWQRADNHSAQPTIYERTAAGLPPRTVRVANPLFRRVPLPSKGTPAPDIPIPPRSEKQQRSETQSVPEPAKPKPPEPQPVSTARPPSASVVVTQERGSEHFVAQAMRFITRTEAEAEPVPFSQYRPTYADMTPAQQRWYFYWRTELRAGRFLPADLSYLFVYVYEGINLVGFTTPQAAFDQLVQFWQYYRGLQPKLDHYLIDWLADFLVIHHLPLSPLAWYGQVLTKLTKIDDPELLLEGWLVASGKWEMLPNALLYRLASYTPAKSKFYASHPQPQTLDAAYKQGVQAIDTHLIKTTGIALFETYAPQSVRVIRRPPFASALQAYAQTPITIGQVRSWLGQTDLATSLQAILKQVENVLRTQTQFKTRLRGIDLPPTWVEVIEHALVTPTAKRTIAINFAHVAALQSESEEIRRRLTVEAEVQTTQNSRSALDLTSQRQKSQVDSRSTNGSGGTLDTLQLRSMVKQDATLSLASTLSNFYTQRPSDAPDGLLTDLAEVAVVIGEAASVEVQLLRVLRGDHWQASSTILQNHIQGGFLNVIIDRINARAFEQLGDALIFQEDKIWVVAEDYRDEIAYILDHPAFASNGSPQQTSEPASEAPLTSATTAENSQLPTTWVQLGDYLQEYHRAALAILLEGTEVKTRLDALARRFHSTANQVVDEINELALEYVGDIVIITQGVTPVLEEEYFDNLRRLPVWARTQAMSSV